MSKINISFFTGVLLVFLLITVSCDKQTDRFEVTGKLENLAGDYFYMSHELGDLVHIDTIPVNAKGEFSYKAKVDTLTVMSLYFNQNTKNTFILVNKNWKVELKGDALYPDLIDVKGGDVNDDITDFKNTNKDLLKSRADILKSAEDRILNGDSTVAKDYVMDLKNINFELSNLAAAYVKANPEKIASVMLINSFFKDETSIPRLEENLSFLKGKATDFPLAEELRNFKNKVKASAIGAYAPSFPLKDIKEKDIQLSDLKGKYVLLSFVATTCDVCRDERRDMIAVYNELKKQKKNIEFISIVKDDEQVPISENITDSVKWNIAPVKGGWSAKPFDLYYVREIPYNILISPTGYILERDLPIHDLQRKLEERPDKGEISKNKK